MAAALIDSRVPSATTFNTIPHYERQIKTLDASILAAISKIFIATGANDAFGAGILHRHQDLHDGQAIVHTISNQYVDVAEIKDISGMDRSSLKGTAFFLNQEGFFQPYEFASTTDLVPSLKPAFTRELAEFLKANKLENYVAVVPNPHKIGGMGNMLEYTILDGKVNIRIPHRVGTAPVTGTNIAEESCEWGFSHDGVMEATICKGVDHDCSKNLSDDYLIQQATICKGANASCNSATVKQATICKGEEASCTTVSGVHEGTICKGSSPSCNIYSVATSGTTICKGAEDICDYNDTTICKGVEKSCLQGEVKSEVACEWSFQAAV